MTYNKHQIEKIRELKKQGKKHREIRAITGAAFDTISKYGVIEEPPLTPSTTSATTPNINQTVSQSPSTSPTPKTLPVKNPVVPQEQLDQFDKLLKAIEKNKQSSKDNTRDLTNKDLEQRVLQLELDKQEELKIKETFQEKQANEPKLYDIKQQHVQPNPQPTTDPILEQKTNPEEKDTTSYDEEPEYFEIQPYHLTFLANLVTLPLAIYTAKRTGVFNWPVTNNKSNKIKTIKPNLPSIQAENKKFYEKLNKKETVVKSEDLQTIKGQLTQISGEIIKISGLVKGK
ncbi:MAG: hypothetical protein MUO82_01735 [Candidatus Thermoplasmatota archaeon]|nr:hypothetical protein [Candidatus Thermoplasmatota archaeon]